MKNETRNKTRAAARGSGDGRTGTGRTGARGSGGGNGAGGSEARGRTTVALDEHGAILGATPIEDREQPGRDQRQSASAETPSESASTNAPTRAEAGARKTTATTTARAAPIQTPDDSESAVSGETRSQIVRLYQQHVLGVKGLSTKFGLPRETIKSIIDAETEFEVSESRTLSAPSQKFRASGKKAREQAEQTSLTLLTILDGAIGMTLGQECKMTPDEHKMIDEPLARILARMTPETTELIDKWTDPLLLATGLIMWGARVFLVLSREVKREARKHKAEPIKPEPAEPSIGLDLNHPIQATGIPVEVAEALG